MCRTYGAKHQRARPLGAPKGAISVSRRVADWARRLRASASKGGGGYRTSKPSGVSRSASSQPTVTLEVVDSAAPIRGGSDAAWKLARLDTGLEIMVPLFIAPAKESAWTRPGANTLGAKARGRSKGKIKINDVSVCRRRLKCPVQSLETFAQRTQPRDPEAGNIPRGSLQGTPPRVRTPRD